MKLCQVKSPKFLTGCSEYVGTFIILCLSSDQGISRCRAETKGPHLPSPFDWHCTVCHRNSSALRSASAAPSGRIFVLFFPGLSLAAPSRDALLGMARSGSSPGWCVHLVIMLTYFSRSIFSMEMTILRFEKTVLANDWLVVDSVMRWIHILKHKLPVGLHLEVVIRRVLPLSWEWFPCSGRWERPYLFSLSRPCPCEGSVRRHCLQTK